MFDGVLLRGPRPASNWSAGVTLALTIHTAVFLWLLQAENAPRAPEREDPSVTLMVRAALAPTPPPPPPPPPPARKHQNTPVTRVKKELVVPREVPKELPPEPEKPSEEPAATEEPGGVEGGEEGGVEGGVLGGTVGGQLGGQLGGQVTAPVEYNDQMSPIRKVSGPEIEYTQQALDREIEGTMVVKCVIGFDGRVRDCRVVKSLPFLDVAVVAALSQRRYEPVKAGGRPVEVEYTFKIPFRLPE